MGADRITQVVDALQAAGFRADRGFPGKKIPDITTPAVAVNLGEQNRERVMLLVNVYCSGDLGGVYCEDQSLAVAATLKSIGGNCSVGSCAFQSKSGLFCVEIKAVWSNVPPVRVLVEGTELPYVTAVTAQQSWGEVYGDDGTTVSIQRGWSVFVEEMLPPGSFLMEKEEIPFDILLCHDGGSEEYSGCYWDLVTSKVTTDGVYRKREAWTWNKPTLTRGEG